MSARPDSNSFLKGLAAFAKRVRAALGKDYSIDDSKNIQFSWNTLKNCFLDSSVEQENQLARSFEAVKGDTGKSATFLLKTTDINRLSQVALVWMGRHRKAALVVAGLMGIWSTYAVVLEPYTEQLQARIQMRPAQWSQLQSLIHLARTDASGATSITPTSMANTVSALDEIQLQKMASILIARGLKPRVLLLTADAPPRLELEIDDAMFSVWLDTLEDFRTIWRLYPNQMSVNAGNGAGMVNVSGILTQYGATGGSP